MIEGVFGQSREYSELMNFRFPRKVYLRSAKLTNETRHSIFNFEFYF